MELTTEWRLLMLRLRRMRQWNIASSADLLGKNRRIESVKWSQKLYGRTFWWPHSGTNKVNLIGGSIRAISYAWFIESHCERTHFNFYEMGHCGVRFSSAPIWDGSTTAIHFDTNGCWCATSKNHHKFQQRINVHPNLPKSSQHRRDTCLLFRIQNVCFCEHVKRVTSVGPMCLRFRYYGFHRTPNRNANA